MTPQLDEMWEELQRGNVFECSLRNAHFHVEGLQDGERVYVDPRPAILETLLHELLHRRFRAWGERRVLREAKLLVLSMDDATKARWWRGYRRVMKKVRPVDVEG